LNGVTVSKYCRHCSRYTKSAGMHSTSEHKGRNKFSYVPPVSTVNAAAPAVAPAPETQLPPIAARMAQVSPPVTPDPVSFAAGPMLRSPHTSYDFSNMGSRDDEASAALPDPYTNGFLSFLGGLPHSSVKDQGR
jgi:hypothetical protein